MAAIQVGFLRSLLENLNPHTSIFLEGISGLPDGDDIPVQELTKVVIRGGEPYLLFDNQPGIKKSYRR